MHAQFRMIKNEPKPFSSHLGQFGSHLGQFQSCLRRFEVLLDHRRVIGSPLGEFLTFCKSFCDHLVILCDHLVVIWDHLGIIWDHLRDTWCHLVVILVHSDSQSKFLRDAASEWVSQ